MKGLYTIDESTTTVPSTWITGLADLTLRRGQLITAKNDGTFLSLSDDVWRFNSY